MNHEKFLFRHKASSVTWNPRISQGQATSQKYLEENFMDLSIQWSGVKIYWKAQQTNKIPINLIWTEAKYFFPSSFFVDQQLWLLLKVNANSINHFFKNCNILFAYENTLFITQFTNICIPKIVNRRQRKFCIPFLLSSFLSLFKNIKYLSCQRLWN